MTTALSILAPDMVLGHPGFAPDCIINIASSKGNTCFLSPECEQDVSMAQLQCCGGLAQAARAGSAAFMDDGVRA